jgi:hypothetical protein
MSQKLDEKTDSALTKLGLLAKLLGLLERLLPAFLVAWNNELRNRAKKAEFKAEKLDSDLKITRHKLLLDYRNHGIKNEEIIDNFLKRKSRSTSNEDDPSR